MSESVYLVDAPAVRQGLALQLFTGKDLDMMSGRVFDRIQILGLLLWVK